MSQLDIYICTKSKCTAKRVQVKVWATDAEQGSYNGPALLDAIRELVEKKHLQEQVRVHEVACMAGCPVGPRVDMICGSKRVMYFHRKNPTGREDLIGWQFIESVESAIEEHLRESEIWN